MSRLANFPVVVEEKLIALLLKDAEFLSRTAHLIKPDYFRDDYKPILKVLLRHYVKHRTLLDRTALADASKQSMVVIKRLLMTKVAKLSRDYYAERLVNFAKTYQLENFCLAVAGMVEDDTAGRREVEYDGLEKEMREIMEIGIIHDLGTDYFTNAVARLKSVSDYDASRIPTGFPLYDKLLNGGLGLTEMGIIVSGPHRGKSQVMVNFGQFAVQRGFHVVHQTLEMPGNQVAVRYDCRTAMMTREEIKNKKKSAYYRIKKLREMNNGKLVIQDLRKNRPTVAMLSAMMKMYIHKYGKPDLWLLDYADLLKPSAGYRGENAKRLGVSDIYTDLRFLAGELDLRLWTISQANRIGMAEEVIEMEHLAETIDKAAIADIICTLCQTKDEKKKGVLRLHNAKNRDGASGQIIRLQYDFSRALVRETQAQ